MKAFILYNSYSHLSLHERQPHRGIVVKKLWTAPTKEELFHKVYGRNCSETYCYPRGDYRFVSKSLAKEFKQWEKDGGIELYAKYNKMD